MLLFIQSGIRYTLSALEFQNIVCYCLSFFERGLCQRKHISKHRMLLFIDVTEPANLKKKAFQNIVCYCLSLEVHLVNCSGCHFKTSYVTVYLIKIELHHFEFRYFKTSYVTVYLAQTNYIYMRQ